MTGAARLAVLVSGGGSNLQAILDASARGDLAAAVVLVVSDRPEVYALVRALNAGVPAHVVDRRERDQAQFEREIVALIETAQVELICLAGFVQILSADFVARFRDRILNIHPSLLPKHGGKGMYGERVHRAVLAAGDRESGCTVHVVTGETDAGPIIHQARVSVHPDDTPASLAARVATEEHRAYPTAIAIAIEHLGGGRAVAARGEATQERRDRR